MSVGALIGGGISALGSLGGSLLQSGASQTASQQQLQGTQESLYNQLAMYNTTRGELQPFISGGQSVLPTLSSLLTPGASQTKTLSQLPGFQFQSQWGDLAATNQLAAQGLGGSAGPLGKALSDYNQGLAGTSFNNLVSQIQSFAGLGANAASALGGVGATTGASLGATAQAGGNAAASGTLGSANALAGGLTGGTSSVGNALLLSQLLQNSGSGNNSSSIYGNVSNG